MSAPVEWYEQELQFTCGDQIVQLVAGVVVFNYSYNFVIDDLSTIIPFVRLIDHHDVNEPLP